jgi:hypothetical protein
VKVGYSVLYHSLITGLPTASEEVRNLLEGLLANIVVGSF